MLTISGLVLISIIYISITQWNKKRIKNISESLVKKSRSYLSLVQTSISLWKILSYNNGYGHFINKVFKLDTEIRTESAYANYLSSSPKIPIETAVILFVTISLTSSIGALPQLIAIFATLLKLINAIQSIYSLHTSIASCYHSALAVTDIVDGWVGIYIPKSSKKQQK